jgi:antitoxin MazE
VFDLVIARARKYIVSPQEADHMRASIARWGNSLAVRVPKEVAASVGLREGAAVEMRVEADAIVLRRRRYDIKDLVAAMAEIEPPPLLLEDEARSSEIW